MRKFTKSEAIGLLVIIFAIGSFLDIMKGRQNIFFIAFLVILMIIGRYQRKQGNTLAGNILLVLGGLLLGVVFLTSLAFSLVIVSIAIYHGYHLFSGTSHKAKVDEKFTPRSYNQTDPLFKNMLAGKLYSSEAVYELDDINIQYGFGDIRLDLTRALIPEGETVILVRGLVGNVQIYVPYDVEVSIQTSMLLGKLNGLENSRNVFNHTQKYQTEDYKMASRRIKILTSLLIGDIEVKNI